MKKAELTREAQKLMQYSMVASNANNSHKNIKFNNSVAGSILNGITYGMDCNAAETKLFEKEIGHKI